MPPRVLRTSYEHSVEFTGTPEWAVFGTAHQGSSDGLRAPEGHHCPMRLSDSLKPWIPSIWRYRTLRCRRKDQPCGGLTPAADSQSVDES